MLGRHAVGDQRVVDARHLRAAADEPEIAEVARRKRPQRLEIVGVAARDDDDVRVRRQRRARDPGGNVFRHDFRGVRKPLAVRELLAIVHDVHAEADLVRQPREMKPDVARADDVELGRWLDRLDVDVHLPAADEPGLLREIVRRARSGRAAAGGW